MTSPLFFSVHAQTHRGLGEGRRGHAVRPRGAQTRRLRREGVQRGPPRRLQGHLREGLLVRRR